MDIQHRLVFVIHASISTGGQSMACPIQIQSNAPGRVPLSRGPISHDIAYITAVTEAEYKSWFEPTKSIPYLALTGELYIWDVFVKIFEKTDCVITALHSISKLLHGMCGRSCQNHEIPYPTSAQHIPKRLSRCLGTRLW